MIVQPTKETKTQASLIALLGGTQKNNTAKSTDTFSKLLLSMAEGLKINKSTLQTEITNTNNTKTIASKSVTPKTDTSKTFNALIDPKQSQELSSLQQLLSGDTQPQTNAQESTLIPKTLLDTLSSDQVRAMISRAKDYLKNEITSKAPEYKADPKSLPKTLMGLVQLADKMGLNPQSITLSTLFTKPSEQTNFTPALLSQPLLDTKLLSSAAKTLPAPPFEAIVQLLSDVKSNTPKTESKNTVLKPEPQNNTVNTVNTVNTELKNNLSKIESKETILKPEVTGESLKKNPDIKQPLSVLLQSLNKPIEGSSIDTVSQTSLSKPAELKVSLSPKTEGIATLLQGEKKEELKTAPSSKTEADIPTTFQAPKADALEVKTKEAVQSMRYFASDLKEAVDSYKPPFTRLSMTLNPEKLGEVEVTLVQRGNNVHVNIQSNNASSVAFLAHNATELKVQLANQGITNATMNFMSGGDGQNQQQGQQQQQQQNRFRAYESLKDIELNGEQLSALEIIIPHYA
ncbi:flagellar hook-length control protein FliK [Sulfuricurvum sp.]|uniref:flagellar hook-length control protein FliK n=1 Tax=Sulfuricurvum sp. TaxID=2025608 RepID=UPI00356524F4